jgi:hypothetical protein
MPMMPLLTLICAAGFAQIVLAIASLAIPKVLRWSEQTAPLRPLIRQVFWTYAGYIWFSNLSFGLVSAFLPESLIAGTPLAAAVTGFVALWWAARLVIQFTYFDRTDAPTGLQFLAGEAALIGLFVSLTLIYGAAAIANLIGATA